MNHPIYRVVFFQIQGPYTLRRIVLMTIWCNHRCGIDFLPDIAAKGNRSLLVATCELFGPSCLYC